MPTTKASIGAKLLLAFLAMGAVIVLQGIYGYTVLARLGTMVVDTFDRPMMAINYGRAANFDFAQIERQLLLRETAPEIQRAAIEADIDDLTSAFASDLAVAEERSTEPDERREIELIKSLVGRWTQARHAHNAVEMDRLARKIDAAFDLLVEFNTDHSFIGRRQAVEDVAQFRYVMAGGLAASLLLALFITLFLTRLIARPLSQAAAVADRIAAGQFETPIPKGGDDETGVLLRSMTVMQDSIRGMVEREKARAVSAEGRLADALETSDEGVMLVGPDGRLAIVNSRLRSFFPSAVAGLVPGANFDELAKTLAGLFVDELGGRTYSSPSFTAGEHRLPDGPWIRISISPTSEGGKIVFVSDFTLVKQREENYKQAKHEAEAASAAKSRFLANMSHELRTPLNAIIGFSEIISAQLFGALGSPRYVDYASDILRSGRHLLDVINSVLELSKSEAGKLSLKTEDLDLREVLRDCVELVAKQCAEAGLTLNINGLDLPLSVRGEKTKLRQTFLNLLSNAIKFTESGGTVTLEVERGIHDFTVAIADTGIGMSRDDVQVALTAFGQVDNRLERKYEGTGLGLPLAKSFVELHGGTLQIESTVGQGTTVTVRLKADRYVAPRLAIAGRPAAPA
jgi:signal transduction histidine kinase/HAMP domain-containing protein